MYLLKLEWLKQKKFVIFKVMTILFLIGLPSMLLILKTINVPDDALPPMVPTVDSLFQFPGVWVYLGYLGNWLTFFFMGFMGVLMVTNEYSNKTMRQNIITGLTRKEYYLSKLYFILSICLVATLYYTFWCLVFGFTHTDTIYLNTVMKNADYFYRFFLMSLGYLSIGFLIGMLVKRTGIALFLYLAYAMIVENILRYGVHLKIANHKSMQYYPINAFEDLAPIPFSDMAEGFAEANEFSFFLSAPEAITCAMVYIGLFLFLGYRKLQKGDL